jgi:aspartate racemase
MVELTAEKIKSLGVSKVYLMATEGTIKTGVYEKYFSCRNIETAPASNAEIAEMMRVIYEVKAGKIPDTAALLSISEKYRKLGCEKIILGCTEFSTQEGRIAGLDENVTVDAMEALKDKILESFGVK